MHRRSLLILGALSPLAFIRSLYPRAVSPGRRSPAELEAEAERLNQLAANIHAPADADVFINFIIDVFGADLPAGLASAATRKRVAHAEFSAASTPAGRIAEDRLVVAWNQYAATLDLPDACKVTQPELHYLRGSLFGSAMFFWNRGHRDIWTAPAIYATEPNGELASGCRAVESLRILWDLAWQPENLRGARDGIKAGFIPSEIYSKAAAAQSPSLKSEGHFVSSSTGPDPVRAAQRLYTQIHGSKALRRAIDAMIDAVIT